MDKFMILLKKDFLEFWRTKKILILSLVFLFFALSSPVLAYYTPEIFKMAGVGGDMQIPKATIFDSYSQFFSNLGQIGLFVLIILNAGQIVSERKKGQFTSLLNNGVNKMQFVLSKIISQILLFLFIYLLSIACFAVYNLILFNKSFSTHSLLSFSLIFVNFLFTIALVNFFSSFSKNMTITMVLSFTTIIILSILNMFSFGKYLPSYLSALADSVLKGENLTNAYQTMGISFLLSLILIALAVRLCSNRD